jgi:hypothetical protein
MQMINEINDAPVDNIVEKPEISTLEVTLADLTPAAG